MKLKPCPFCGKQVAVVSDCEEASCETLNCDICGYRQYQIVCDFTQGGCGSSGSFHTTEEKAIEAWNRRAEPPKEAEFVGAKFEMGISRAGLAGYGLCDYCKYYMLDVNDDPCRDCKHVFCGEGDGLEPIKEEP